MRREFGAVRVSVGRGLSKAALRDDGGGRLAHDFSGAFGHEARFFCCSWRGLTGPWPCCFAAVWLGPLRNVGGPRRWEPGVLGDLWGCCCRCG